jgi:hypothetical protein
MLNLTALSESNVAAIASWVTDLLIRREQHGFFIKSRVEVPIRPLTIEGSDQTYPGFPALTQVLGDAYGLDRATAVALLQKVALSFPQDFAWVPEIVCVPVYDPTTRKPILDANGVPV